VAAARRTAAPSSPGTSAAASRPPALRPAGTPRAGAGPRRTAGTAARRRRGRSSARGGPRIPRRGPGRQLGREPGLADAHLPADQRRGAAPLPGRVEGALELPELAATSDEDLARGSLHPGSIAPPTPGAEGAYASRDRRIGTPAAEDTPPRPMRPRLRLDDDPVDPNRHEEARDDDGRTARDEEDPHGGGRRRPAAARPRVGRRRTAGPVHARLVAEPPVLGQAVPERAGRRVPAGRLRPARPRDVAGAAGAGALHRRRLWADDVAAIIDQLGLDRPVLVGWSYAASSSATTCARTARTGSPPSTSSPGPSAWARRRSAR
jgi:hypothetical protein